MSNFSNVYKHYLQGYVGDVYNAAPSEQQLKALALGVYHRTTSKPPLMSSVAVTAELRAMSDTKTAAPCKAYTTLELRGGVSGSTKIPIIKVIREITGLGLKESKDITDDVEVGRTTLVRPGSWWHPELTDSDRVEAAAKLLREAGCVVEVS